jgi:hypothetical protein
MYDNACTRSSGGSSSVWTSSVNARGSDSPTVLFGDGVWLSSAGDEVSLSACSPSHISAQRRLSARMRPKNCARSVTPTAPRASSTLNACEVFST